MNRAQHQQAVTRAQHGLSQAMLANLSDSMPSQAADFVGEFADCQKFNGGKDDMNFATFSIRRLAAGNACNIDAAAAGEKFITVTLCGHRDGAAYTLSVGDAFYDLLQKL